jgi:hypothetical protein
LSREISCLLSDSYYSEQQLLKFDLIKQELFSPNFFDGNLHSVFEFKDEISKNQDVMTVTISVKQNWVHFFNSFVRNSSFFLENLKSPFKILVFFIFRLFYQFGITRLIRLVIGENNYEKFKVRIKTRMKF